MGEIVFEVRDAEEGGFNAHALGFGIFTQGDDWEDLKAMVKDAVACHFDGEPECPASIRVRFVRDEVLTA